jgi:hypothetical protein
MSVVEGSKVELQSLAADGLLHQCLAHWRAADQAHTGDDLAVHLTGVYALLCGWQADPVVARVGLLHAVDGTVNAPTAIRPESFSLLEVLGERGMDLFRLYVDCDRNHVWPQLGAATVDWVSRHDQRHEALEGQRLRDFCELTMANELEILLRNRAHRDQHAAAMRPLLARLRPNVSALAWQSFLAFGEIEPWTERLLRRSRQLTRRILGRLRRIWARG